MSTLPEALARRFEIAPQSVHELGSATVMIGRDAEKTALLVLAPTARMLPEGFVGDISEIDGRALLSDRKHFFSFDRLTLSDAGMEAVAEKLHREIMGTYRL